jgi:hypothetical protein
MRVVNKDLMVMMVAELKEELEVRGEGKTGNKAWLRRRLHSHGHCARVSRGCRRLRRGLHGVLGAW